MTEPGYPPHPEPGATQAGIIHDEEKEDIKPKTLPTAGTHVPVYHSQEHYPVIVMKSEDAPPTGHVQVVIPEEKPSIEPQPVAGADLHAHQEEQSYDQEAVEEHATEQEIEDPNVNVDDQEQRILHSQEQTETAAMYEQTPEQAQEVDQQRFAQEERDNLPAPDSSVAWMQEPATEDAQEPEAFYTPEEQNIPQSQSYPEEFQEESHGGDVLVSSDSHEPWVMVEYPPPQEEDDYYQEDMNVPQGRPNDRFASEQDDYYPPEEDVDVPQEIPPEMQNDRFAPEQGDYYPPREDMNVPQEMPMEMQSERFATQQDDYYPPQEDISVTRRMAVEIQNDRFAPEVPDEAGHENEEEGVEIEEVAEPPVVEVSA